MKNGHGVKLKYAPNCHVRKRKRFLVVILVVRHYAKAECLHIYIRNGNPVNLAEARENRSQRWKMA